MKSAILVLALAVAGPATAETIPVPGIGDPRIQVVEYDPDQVVRINTAPGYTLTIEFSPGERIENIAVGESVDWQITANRRGDLLFIKQAPAAPETNLTVITDARRYAFILVPGYGPDPSFAYVLRFRYPVSPDVVKASVDQQRFSYKLAGNKALWPQDIYDDGHATYIQWHESQSLPAVYAHGTDGGDTIVNGAMRDGWFVIDAITPQLILRSGKSKATATRRKPRSGS